MEKEILYMQSNEKIMFINEIYMQLKHQKKKGPRQIISIEEMPE